MTDKSNEPAEENNKHEDFIRKRAVSTVSLPLYQIYSEIVEHQARQAILRAHNLSIKEPNADTLRALKNARILWRDTLQVRTSGVLKKLTEKEINKQEAVFEILTSETSYVKSLMVFVDFYMRHMMQHFVGGGWVTEGDLKALSHHMTPILDLSQKFKMKLAAHSECDIMMPDFIVIIEKHVSESFKHYINYAKNYLDVITKYKQLCEKNENLKIVMKALSREPRAQRQPLESFFLLPIQRVTRYPLLVETVMKHTDQDDPSYLKWFALKKTLQKKARECDKEVEKNERRHEMKSLRDELKADSKARTILSDDSRYILLRADVTRRQFKKDVSEDEPLHLILFNDFLMVTRHSPGKPNNYDVTDYCKKEYVKIQELEKIHLIHPELARLNPISLTLKRNQKGQESNMLIVFNGDKERQKWTTALDSVKDSEKPKIIFAKQVIVLRDYSAEKPDELTLNVGDVVGVIDSNYKCSEWCQGERIRDGKIGWFPGECAKEIVDEDIKNANWKMRESRRNSTVSVNSLNRATTVRLQVQ